MNDWCGCYDAGWQREIVPEAYAHPAKFSRGLIRRIFEHAFAEGWLHAGDVCVDPFGGVALGGIEAGLRGVQWLGIELEPRFVELGNQNIDLWQRKYSSLNGWTRPVLLQGDSRKLAQIVGQAGMICGSPPYACMDGHPSLGHPEKFKELGSGIMNHTTTGTKPGDEKYGTSPGQLGAMKEGEAPALVVGSPPYAESLVVSQFDL